MHIYIYRERDRQTDKQYIYIYSIAIATIIIAIRFKDVSWLLRIRVEIISFKNCLAFPSLADSGGQEYLCLRSLDLDWEEFHPRAHPAPIILGSQLPIGI